MRSVDRTDTNRHNPGSGNASPTICYIAVGGLRTDYVITAEGQVILGRHGGNAIYAAAGMWPWANSVGLVGRVGSNFPPEWLSEAQTVGLDLLGVRRLPTWQETRTFYAYLPDDRRLDSDPARHFSSLGLPLPPELEGYTSSTVDFGQPRPNPLSLTLDDLPPSYLQAAGIHLAPYDLWSHQNLVPALAQASDAVITLDPNYGCAEPQYAPAIFDLLPHVAAFLPSQLEATGLLGQATPAEAAQEFARRGAPIVAVKLGAQGSLVLDAAQDRLWYVPAYPVRVRDLTGAGDSFCGGFLVGYAESGDPVRAAQYGTVSASFVIESDGGLAATARTRSEAEQRLQWLNKHRPPQAF